MPGNPSAARLRGIFRYPVKGLRPEPLDRVSLRPGKGVPVDRRFALALPDGAVDPTRPAWAPKRNFLMLMRDEALAPLGAAYREDTRRLAILEGARRVVEADLDRQGGRDDLEVFFMDLLGLSARPHLVESPDSMFSDAPEELLSLINLGTLGELEAVLGKPLDPTRFRGNLLIDGPEPFAELAWLGRPVRIGGAAFEVVQRIDRCAAVNVDPTTAERDLNIPGALRQRYGHIDCGVYLRVVSPGDLTVGDDVQVLDP